eukprot:m.8876 g.8876  ORF g.8876 m.8876 type:complete len:2271 (-) comp3968_c0_seq1:482-7294(-)
MASGGGGGAGPPAGQNLPGRRRITASFFVTKHSWKGKYKRILCVTNEGVHTMNPANFEETNNWPYEDEFVNILPSMKSELEFTITTKKKDSKKTTITTFSCNSRTDLLTAAQVHRKKFWSETKVAPDPVFSAFKEHWSGERKEVMLSAHPHALVQVNGKGHVVAKYNYRDIEAICLVSDYPGGFVVFYGGYARMHLFALEKREELLRKIAENANNNIGRNLRVQQKTVTTKDFKANRLGSFSNDQAVTSLNEFLVNKISPRHGNEPQQRIFATSETCIIERDPATYGIVTCRPLQDVLVLVRPPDDPQKFVIEYKLGEARTYLSTDRDAMLATLMDSIRAAGNNNVCIQIHRSQRGERYAPLTSAPEEEIESTLLKHLSQPTELVSFGTAVLRFNSNINFSGLVHAVSEEGWFKENKERLIFNALNALLVQGERTVSPAQAAGEFMAIRRLVASKAGFAAFTTLPNFKEQVGVKVVKALKWNNDGVTCAALDVLATLMQPMHEDYDLGQEQRNKKSLLSSRPFLEKLAELLKLHADAGTGALVVSGLLDIFTFGLCAPYSETTDSAQFDVLLEVVGGLGRSLYRLFEHPSLAIVKAAGLLMKAIIEEGSSEMCEKMQYYSLAEGSLPKHLHTALFTQSMDNRLLTHRQLSRHLVGLWTANNSLVDGVLRRILPAGLVGFLNSKEEVPDKEIDRMHVRDNMKVLGQASGKKISKKNLDKLTQHWRTKSRSKASKKERNEPVTLRRRRQNLKVTGNWDYFFYQFYADHAQADLIWNFKTREELREALEAECRAFSDANALRGKQLISWNHTEFEIRYETLAEEIKIGDHYLRLLLEADPKASDIHNPLEFFNDLYHRFLLTTVPKMKSMCLQAMAVVYGACFDKIGAFNDTEYIVTMLNRCEDSMERDRLLEFLFVLLKNKKNAKLFIDAGGVRCLVDMVTLAHLHTTRATVPLQTNVLEASASQLADDDAEWYYSLSKDPKDKHGPVGFNKIKELYEEGVINKETRMWAQGMESWQPMRKIAQLKWTLVATGQPLHDFSSLCVLCLNMMLRICHMYPTRDKDDAIIRPIPRCKRMLCEANCLPHIVQLLLTFDPIIVEKTAILLYDIMSDNMMMSRLYLTGAFFFIMMYTGSNILPVAKFLAETHSLQAFQSAEGESSKSILSNMLPEAMICFIENYGAEKFASIFLGEFDTPEAIWGGEMRRFLIEKIALHLSDFTSRLQSNTRALYQYCPIPKVNYSQLEDELFCSIFYLRHLCDETRFPDWPIKDFIQLLKDVLDAWKVEVDKKPETMSVDEAYETLGLKVEGGGAAIEQSKVRKAYFKMSMKYHPDKNPEGRDMFEKVNKAYEFISSRNERDTSGPNPENLVLILRAQSILFKRFKEGLAPYKYAGYPMLMTTITRETEDENLFSSSVGLLAAACELAHLTVDCSALNAEELRRNGGIEILAKAMQRCISVIGHETSEEEMAAKVCIHILRCFAAACQFEGCREKITEKPQIMKDVCRCLWFKGAPTLTMAAMDCVSAMSVEEYLQNHLLQAGVLWHLMLRLFKYDYTLDESGVEAEEESNAQLFFNNHAKKAIVCLARLGGYGKCGTPKNPAIQKSCSVLLTPHLADQIAHEDPKFVLKELNLNSENPYLIWDNATRAELIDFLEKQQEDHIKNGESDPSFGCDFTFSAHRDELNLARVFVRIYNLQSSYPLKNPKEFTTALLDFLGTQSQYLFSQGVLETAGTPSSPAPEGDANEEKPKEDPAEAAARREAENKTRLTNACHAMEALRNVIRGNKGVELLCKGHFKLIFSLLKYDLDAKLQNLSLEVISTVISNRECVADIASAKVLVYLLLVTQTHIPGRALAIEAMHGLMSNPKILAEAEETGTLLYLLDMFCSSTNQIVREGTAALLAKIMNDKLRGPKVRIVLAKFLPNIFMDAMRDNPEASLSMFEGTHENPELIWNEDARSKVQSVVSELKLELYEQQSKDPSITWSLPNSFEVVYENVGDELVVGGVFMHLLLKQPNWVFRKPKDFLVAALEKYLQLLQSESSDRTRKHMELLTDAFCGLLRNQNGLNAQVASLGHINKLAAALGAVDSEKQASLLRFFNELAESKECVRAIAGLQNFMGPVHKGLKGCTRSALAPGLDMIGKCLEITLQPFVSQAVDSGLVKYMVDLLREELDTIESAAAAKAHCVNALKAMAKDLQVGEKVSAILNEAPWWATYKDQRHDLFITTTTTAGYLTGPTSTVAGYLMAGSASTAAMSDKPPDMDVEEPVSRVQNLLGDD